MTFPSIDNARAWFDFVDADGNGSLTQREVAGALKASIPDLDTDTFDRELPQLWQRWDKNGDGTISYHELFAADGLLAYARSRRGGSRDGEPPPLSDGDAWFRFWDYDGSGDLTKNELRRALSKTFGLTGQTGDSVPGERCKMAVFNERETELGELAWAAQWRNLATRRIVELFFASPSVLQAASPRLLKSRGPAA